MKQLCMLVVVSVCFGVCANADGISAGIYGPEDRDRQEGIYGALDGASGIGSVRYVKDVSPESLKGVDVLIVPQILHPNVFTSIREPLAKWIAEGHGVMTIHDAVGYRKHPCMFPEFAKGVGNPFNRDTGFGKFCIIAAEHPAVTGFDVPGVVEHGYYDQVTLEAGEKGIVLVREAVFLDEQDVETGVPVVIAGLLGKGRYVANGLAVGYNESAKQGVPEGDELKLFLGLVHWLAGEGDAGRVADIGPGVKAVRKENEDLAAKKEQIEKEIEEISSQAIEPWNGKWHKSDMGPAPEVVESSYKSPIVFPPELLKPSGYTDVAEGWTRTELRDEWKCMKLESTADNPADDQGTKQGFEKPGYDDSQWESQPVPKLSMHVVEHFTGVKWYRRPIALPELKTGQRVVLTLTRCGFDTKVWVNGKYIGEHIGSSTPFEFDVTDAVQEGKTNILALRVFDMTGGEGSFTLPDGSVLHEAPYSLKMGHLWGEVYVTVKPEFYAHRTLITPHLASSEIEVDTWLFNPGKETQVDLKAEVLPAPPPMAKGKGESSSTDLKSVKLPPGISRHTFKVPMKNPIPWTTENPFLYTLEMKNGADVLARERFGFREFGIEGPYFVLNGKKINLVAHGVNRSTFDMSRRIQVDNEGMYMTRYLLAVKSWNANTAYTMAATLPSQVYDMCDELGVLMYADWNAEFKNFSNVSAVDGWNKGEPEIIGWMAERYNHPTTVMTAIGAELFESYTPSQYRSYTDLLNPVYDSLKAFDKQNRPVCPSSGRNTWMTDDAKTDIHDFHAYPGNIGQSWTDEKLMILNVWKYGLAQRPVIPVVQYELDGARFFNLDLKAIQALLKAEAETGRMDRKEVIRLAQQKPYRMGLGWLSSLYGFRRYADDLGKNGGWRQGAGWQTFLRKNAGQQSRIAGPLLAGYCANTEPFGVADITVDGQVPDTMRGWIHNRLGKGWDITDDLSEKKFVESEGYRTWKRINSPTLICMDRYDRNLLAGATFKTDVYAINDIDAPSKPWKARCVVMDAEGKVMDDRVADVGIVGGFKRKILPYSYTTSADLPTGFYNIKLYLYEGNKVISDNYEQFFILGKKDQIEKVDSMLKIALYDSRAKRYDSGISTKEILDELKVSCAAVSDFDTISDYDVLIIGADSMDETVRDSSRKLTDWIKGGGRLLQFEQHAAGAIPYYRKIKMLAVKPHIMAEIIEANHPVFDGLTYRNMEQWSDLPDSRTPGEVYRQLLGPISQDVLASGTVSVPRENAENNQMVMSESVIGDGRLVLSQFEATQRYGTDAVATRLIGNMIRYIAGEHLWQVDQDVTEQ